MLPAAAPPGAGAAQGAPTWTHGTVMFDVRSLVAAPAAPVGSIFATSRGGAVAGASGGGLAPWEAEQVVLAPAQPPQPAPAAAPPPPPSPPPLPQQPKQVFAAAPAGGPALPLLTGATVAVFLTGEVPAQRPAPLRVHATRPTSARGAHTRAEASRELLLSVMPPFHAHMVARGVVLARAQPLEHVLQLPLGAQVREGLPPPPPPPLRRGNGHLTAAAQPARSTRQLIPPALSHACVRRWSFRCRAWRRTARCRSCRWACPPGARPRTAQCPTHASPTPAPTWGGTSRAQVSGGGDTGGRSSVPSSPPL